MKYAVVVEKSGDSFGAYIPDLQGCVAVGDSEQEVLDLIKEAAEFHIEGMIEDGLDVPKPQCIVSSIDVNKEVA